MPRSTFRSALLLAALLALVSAGVACSKDSTTTTPTGAAQAPAGGGGATLEQGAGGAMVFSPTKLTVKQGDTITVSNVGSVPHTFTVTGQSVDVTNQPGQSQQVKIDLPPGTYPFVCTFHASSGMTGTLVVTGSAGGAPGGTTGGSPAGGSSPTGGAAGGGWG